MGGAEPSYVLLGRHVQLRGCAGIGLGQHAAHDGFSRLRMRRYAPDCVREKRAAGLVLRIISFSVHFINTDIVPLRLVFTISASLSFSICTCTCAIPSTALAW